MKVRFILAGYVERNFHKHNVCFSDAESVLFDPSALTIEDTTQKMNSVMYLQGWIR